MKSLLLVPYTFVLLNWAAVAALICFLRGRGLEGLWTEPGAAAPERAATLLRPARS